MGGTEQWSVEQYRAHFESKKQPTEKKTAGDKQKYEIEMMIKLSGLDYLLEHKFSKNRKFRFDFAIPSLMLSVEYEGVYGGKSRHTTVEGYTTDTEKYNLAQIEGWIVLRYTASNYQKFADDLRKVIELRNEQAS